MSLSRKLLCSWVWFILHGFYHSNIYSDFPVRNYCENTVNLQQYFPVQCQGTEMVFWFKSLFCVMFIGFTHILFLFLPWLDRAKVRSVRYRGNLYKSSLILFVISFFILGYLGVKPTNVWGSLGPLFGDIETAVVVARICTMFYFAFFILMPLITKFDKTKPLPKNLT